MGTQRCIILLSIKIKVGTLLVYVTTPVSKLSMHFKESVAIANIQLLLILELSTFRYSQSLHSICHTCLHVQCVLHNDTTHGYTYI